MLNGTSLHTPRHARRRRVTPRRRRFAVTAPGLALITIATLAVLAGCSSSGSSSSAVTNAANSAHGAPTLPSAAPAATSSSAAGAGFGAAGGKAQDNSATRFTPDDQQLIYTAQLTVRAGNVAAALSRATSIVTGAGGYVSAENSTGGGSGPAAAKATAVVTLKIPAAVYPATLAQLTGTGLGTQLSLQQQAQDVTQQVADVSSRVASDEAAITALRALLKHAGSVDGLLSVQDQINSEESDLESMLAQQQALDHETSYATVTLTLVGPKVVAKPKAKRKPAPPPGLLGGLAGGWRAFRLTVDWLLAIIGAVAPFAAVVAVVGFCAWWARRRLTRSGSRGTGPGATPAGG